MSAEQTPARRGSLVHRWRLAFADYCSRPFFDYYVIMSVVVLLTFIGTMTVVSSSTASSLGENDNVWYEGIKHIVYVVVGFSAMIMVMHMPVRLLRLCSNLLLFVTMTFLVLVLVVGVGADEVGAKSWLAFGPVQFQPSELAKVTLAIWGAHFLADPEPRQVRYPWDRNRFVWYIVVALVMIALIMKQPDRGMAGICTGVMVLVIAFAGISRRGLTTMVVSLGTGAALYLLYDMVFKNNGGDSYRADRIRVYRHHLFGDFSDTRGSAYQAYQGFLSLSEGGFMGVGPGQSKSKWFYLPEAKNDYIFAVIGEELGFFGAAIVIILFTALGIVGVRCARKSTDRYFRMLAVTLTAGVVAQAFYNIAYVIGIVPVTGIQLPMVSAGGTSMCVTLGSMGLLAAAARHEPEAVSAMRFSGRPAIDRLLFLKEPEIDRLEPAEDEHGGRKGNVRRTATPTRTPRSWASERANTGDGSDRARPRRDGEPRDASRRTRGAGAQGTQRRPARPRRPAREQRDPRDPHNRPYKRGRRDS